MAYDPDERISRKDAARLARRSQDTIRRLERRHHLSVERDDASQQVTYRVQDLVDLGVLHIEDVATAGSAAESAELAGARETIAHLRADVAERDGRLSYAEVSSKRCRGNSPSRTSSSPSRERRSTSSPTPSPAGAPVSKTTQRYDRRNDAEKAYHLDV